LNSSEKPITNGDVITLAKAGLGDEIVVAKIQQAPAEVLDVSVDSLIQLKKEGLSKPIIDAMIKRAGQRGEAQGQGSGTSVNAPAADPRSSSKPDGQSAPTLVTKPGAYRSPIVVETKFAAADRSLWGLKGKAFTIPEWWELGNVSCDGVYLRGDTDRQTQWDPFIKMKARELSGDSVEVTMTIGVQNAKHNQDKTVTLLLEVVNGEQRAASASVRIKAPDNGQGSFEDVLFTLPAAYLRTDPMTKLRITMTTNGY
jgi:hypothetical protein